MLNTASNAREKKKNLVNKNFKIFWTFTITCFLLDQISKLVVLRILVENYSHKIFRYFSLTCIKNSGICFGLFSNSNIQLPVIIGSVIIFSFIIFHINRTPKITKYFQVSLGLIQGGILGNLVDRVRFGAVVDFLDFHVWPVFNLADTFIVSGVLLLLLLQFRGKNASGIY